MCRKHKIVNTVSGHFQMSAIWVHLQFRPQEYDDFKVTNPLAPIDSAGLEIPQTLPF